MLEIIIVLALVLLNLIALGIVNISRESIYTKRIGTLEHAKAISEFKIVKFMFLLTLFLEILYIASMLFGDK